jgi:hypothetical protein
VLANFVLERIEHMYVQLGFHTARLATGLRTVAQMQVIGAAAGVGTMVRSGPKLKARREEKLHAYLDTQLELAERLITSL